MTTRTLAWGLVAVALASGCATPAGSKGTPGATPSSIESYSQPAAASPEPTTLEEAEALLERARADIEAVAFAEPPPPAPASAPTMSQSPVTNAERAAPSGAPPREDEAADKAVGEEAAEKKEESPCETACKAYSSLLRARDAVCRLDDPGGARCSRADGIVRNAGARVAACRCQP